MRALIILISLIFLVPPQGGNYRLVVDVTGLKPLKGDLYITLNNRPEYFQVSDSALMKTIIHIDEETETIIFDNLGKGTYALAVYHDLNLNRSLDVNGLGIPREGFGFSNNPKVAFGMPGFEDAAFNLIRNDTVGIIMNYRFAADQK